MRTITPQPYENSYSDVAEWDVDADPQDRAWQRMTAKQDHLRKQERAKAWLASTPVCHVCGVNHVGHNPVIRCYRCAVEAGVLPIVALEDERYPEWMNKARRQPQ